MSRSTRYIRPEPAWWAEARTLQASGMAPVAIAQALNRKVWTVRYALSEARQTRTRERQRRQRAKHSTIPFPFWWLEAECLHRLGCSKLGISRILDRPESSVRFALNEGLPARSHAPQPITYARAA